MGVEADVLAEIRGLREKLPHITGVIVASVDGLLVAHDAPGVDVEVMAAMSSAHLGLGRQLARSAAHGDFEEATTRAQTGYVATFAAGASAVLTVLASAELNVGRLYHEARPVAARLGALTTPAPADGGAPASHNHRKRR